ncbi:MAG: DUF2330 domain-containing protein [Myxococcota bacterium]
MIRTQAWMLAACLSGALLLTLTPTQAEACGGFFCSQSQPVNQAAERIIFIDNDDDTVTAIVQILYQGPSEQFAWVLPVPGIPEVGVSSDLAFQRLQQATNPLYNLVTRFEDNCTDTAPNGSNSFAGATSNGTAGNTTGGGGVNVLASGAVGPYDYVVLMADPNAPDPAQETLDWLTDNGYDLTSTAPELLEPYLRDGMNLLAFRLTKGNEAGDIRPVMLTYDSERPMIPIKLTAVAAEEDMGVLVWTLSDHRTVPVNYRALKLNEAILDWTNPGSSYNAVINAAADEAGGQGFVTEFAEQAQIGTPVASRQILLGNETTAWERINAYTSDSTNGQKLTMLQEATFAFGSWDGFMETLRNTLPTANPEGLIQCLSSNGFDTEMAEDGLSLGAIVCDGAFFDDQQEERIDLELLSVGLFQAELTANVYEPMERTQELLRSQAWMTRMYTTLSAAEMTVDPVFDNNTSLGSVSNIHTAEQWITCDPNAEYTWRVVLSDGSEVFSTDGLWPYTPGSSEMPVNRRVVQENTTDDGEVVTDNLETIQAQLSQDRPEGVAPIRTGIPNSPDEETEMMIGQGDEEGCACTHLGPQRPAWPMTAWGILLGFAGIVWRRARQR